MCWHKWTQWKVTSTGTGEYVFGGGQARFVYQQRRCLRCNKVELNKQVV